MLLLRSRWTQIPFFCKQFINFSIYREDRKIPSLSLLLLTNLKKFLEQRQWNNILVHLNSLVHISQQYITSMMTQGRKEKKKEHKIYILIVTILYFDRSRWIFLRSHWNSFSPLWNSFPFNKFKFIIKSFHIYATAYFIFHEMMSSERARKLMLEFSSFIYFCFCNPTSCPLTYCCVIYIMLHPLLLASHPSNVPHRNCLHAKWIYYDYVHFFNSYGVCCE